MIRRLVQIVIFVPLAVVLIALSVANRHAVSISLDPFGGTEPGLSVSLPLFLIIFGALLVGVLIGGSAAWFSQGKWRRSARQSRSEAKRQRFRADEAERVKEAASSGPHLPALRHNS